MIYRSIQAAAASMYKHVRRAAGRNKSAESLRRQRSALADFGLFALRTDDLDELLHKATANVSEAMGIPLVKILELRTAQNEMLVRSGVNWKPGVVGKATFGAGLESPSGYALRSGEPVISLDLKTESRFEIPRLLVEHGVQSMVNVLINGDPTPFGVLEVDSTERSPFDQDDIAFLRNYANLLAAAIHRLEDHKALLKSLDERELLSRELHHRVHNVLALVQSLAKLTTDEGRSAEQFKQVFLPRLSALGRAEALALKEHRNGVDLQELVENVLEPYSIGGVGSIKITGEAVALDAKQARMLALVVHELATNASKYGCLSVPMGHVDLAWQVSGLPERRLTFKWREHGGPPVKPPNSSGFGSRLIERACASELGGNAELHYDHDGLKCDINFTLADLR